MNLKTFVKESLLQIDWALDELSHEITDYNYKYWKNSASNNSIDFEVQVYAEKWTETKGWLWINVAWIMNVWSKWETTKSQHDLSTIKFSVVRERTNEKQKKDRDERKKTFPTKAIKAKY